METVRFEIVADGDSWSVVENSRKAGSYATREVAFEAIVGPISNALKEGSEVTLVIRAQEGGPAL